MEYLGGGEIKWRTASDNPLLRVDQTRRICRDVILGLEYRTSASHSSLSVTTFRNALNRSNVLCPMSAWHCL